MKKQLNEVRRMQVLAGIINEAKEKPPRRVSAYSGSLRYLYSRDRKKFDDPEIFPGTENIDLDQIGQAMNALALEYDIKHDTNLAIENKISDYAFKDAKDNKISKEDFINYVEEVTQNSGITEEPAFKTYIDLIEKMKPILAIDALDRSKAGPSDADIRQSYTANNSPASLSSFRGSSDINNQNNSPASLGY
jgi:hypothetical protein